MHPTPTPPLLAWASQTIPAPPVPGTFSFLSFFCSPTRAAMLSRAEATSGGSRVSGWSSPVSESFSLSSLVKDSFRCSSRHLSALRDFSCSQLPRPTPHRETWESDQRGQSVWL